VKILFVLAGGGLGAVSRYGVSWFAARWWGTSFPWGTLIVNLAGCFLIGLSFGLGDRLSWYRPSGRLFFTTGFLGGLTTFSTLSLETINAANGTAPLVAPINFLANSIVGLALVAAGMWVGAGCRKAAHP
jgi:CrcB protein